MGWISRMEIAALLQASRCLALVAAAAAMMGALGGPPALCGLWGRFSFFFLGPRAAERSSAEC